MFCLDSSALLKTYFREPGAAAVDEILAGAILVVTSSITWAEVHAAFGRQYREGTVRRQELRRYMSDFRESWADFLVFDFTEDIRSLVPLLAPTTPLKGADLIHLVTAIRIPWP
ncbi:MAG: type II toxin-antitoxin system VapC family toxin [Bryobacteraceae bacterium]|nr:type II toxin-antitoxin system VapC family toxin [Bryobacteraceae bacterium]